jgi:hypothetical protein
MASPSDQLIVGDFDGDGKADLYVFNGDDWSIAYLGMFRSTGSALTMVQRYDGDVPGWRMRKNDQFLDRRRQQATARRPLRLQLRRLVGPSIWER